MTEDLKRRDAAYDDLVNRRNQLEQELSEKKALVTKRETNVKTVSQELIKVIDVLSDKRAGKVEFFIYYLKICEQGGKLLRNS